MKELTLVNCTYVTGSDVIPPGRITDLEIHNIKSKATAYGESRSYTVTWTAPGDNMNVGKASRYDLKISENQSLLISDFDFAKNLSLINESIVPQPSGSIEALELVVTAKESYTETTFLAIRAVDHAGNVGKVSNIISITVARGYRVEAAPGIVVDVDFDVVNDFGNTSDYAEGDVSKMGVIIGVSVACGVLVILVVGLIYITRVKRHKTVADDNAMSSGSCNICISTRGTVDS